MTKSICLALFLIIFYRVSVSFAQPYTLIDANATRETRALYRNLHKLAEKHILFGHQHATEYGHGWQGEENRSDVKSVTGSHPAVIGVDFSSLASSNISDSIRQRSKQSLLKTVIDTY